MPSWLGDWFEKDQLCVPLFFFVRVCVYIYIFIYIDSQQLTFKAILNIRYLHVYKMLMRRIIFNITLWSMIVSAFVATNGLKHKHRHGHHAQNRKKGNKHHRVRSANATQLPACPKKYGCHVSNMSSTSPTNNMERVVRTNFYQSTPPTVGFFGFEKAAFNTNATDAVCVCGEKQDLSFFQVHQTK